MFKIVRKEKGFPDVTMARWDNKFDAAFDLFLWQIALACNPELNRYVTVELETV
jgi:hypothetical protein